MSDATRRLLLRMGALAMIALLGLQPAPLAGSESARAACNKSYCDEDCSLLGCVTHAGCAARGSCGWDQQCNGPKITCDEPSDT